MEVPKASFITGILTEVCLHFSGDLLPKFSFLGLINGWEEKGAWSGQKHALPLPYRDASQARGTEEGYQGKAEFSEVQHVLELDCK